MDRREFLASLGVSAGWGVASHVVAQTAPEQPKADVTLRISSVEIDIGNRRSIKTTGYNGSAPGPVLRLREGKPVTIDVFNETSTPELVHWHGLFVPPNVDGAEEEGTPLVPAHGSRRYSFVPRPAGTRWYHTHIHAGRNLKLATYSGQFGLLYVEPKDEPGDYDQEVFLALHGWDPYLSTKGDAEGAQEVFYKSFSVSSHALGYGEPIAVKERQKVIFRILNANATLQHRIALSGHKFNVVSLDGNRVPMPCEVEVLELGPAERADAIVTMNNPGVWILGEVDSSLRSSGMGIVVAYANAHQEARWTEPSSAAWDYTAFGRAGAAPNPDVQVVPLVFRRKWAGNGWVDNWTINGKSYPKTDPIRVRANKRYRLQFDNQSDEPHPVHLHRHSFELTNFAGKASAGVVKDVIVVPARRQVEVDFLADNPGPSLFHCHQQLHMDFGFMALVEYTD